MKCKKVFWGLSLIAIAIFIVVYQMGLISAEIGIWTIVLGVLFGCALLDGIISLSFPGIFFPLAFLWAIFGEIIGLPKVSIWILLLAALLLSIGFCIIFPKKKWKNYKQCGHNRNQSCDFVRNMQEDTIEYTVEYDEANENTDSGENGSHVFCSNKFGATTKYVSTNNLKSGRLENQFGEMIVYFDNAIIRQNSVEISVKASFGSVQLYFPKEWRVENNINVTMGNVEERNQSKSTGTPVVRLVGDVSLGDLEITYI